MFTVINTKHKFNFNSIYRVIKIKQLQIFCITCVCYLKIVLLLSYNICLFNFKPFLSSYIDYVFMYNVNWSFPLKFQSKSL